MWGENHGERQILNQGRRRIGKVEQVLRKHNRKLGKERVKIKEARGGERSRRKTDQKKRVNKFRGRMSGRVRVGDRRVQINRERDQRGRYGKKLNSKEKDLPARKKQQVTWDNATRRIGIQFTSRRMK